MLMTVLVLFLASSAALKTVWLSADLVLPVVLLGASTVVVQQVFEQAVRFFVVVEPVLVF